MLIKAFIGPTEYTYSSGFKIPAKYLLFRIKGIAQKEIVIKVNISI
jgi:hypothetical protein